MNRRVDVKALVSHVLRGDGVNKCRICMGDTTEGQVHLNDTVIMEGDKPVTLSELLEIVTGIQVPLEGDLPVGLCTECWASTVHAANFRSMCRQTSHKWDMTLQLLNNLPSQYSENKTMYVVLKDSEMIVFLDENESYLDTVTERLESYSISQVDKYEQSEKISHAESECYEDKYGMDYINEDDSVTAYKKIKTIVRCGGSRNLDKSKIPLDKIENKNRIEVTQCPNCEKKFSHPMKLCQHLNKSMDMKRACHICSAIMPRDDLVSHYFEIHHKEVFDCKICPALLLTNIKYVNHLKKAHSKGSSTCIDCGQTFQTSQAFCAHTSVHRHKACPYCSKTFRNQTCYFYHSKNCKENVKSETKVDVKNEISKKNIHYEESYKCDYCGKKFAKKKYIAAHIQIVHMKNTHTACAYCGKLLATAHMTEHLKKHELNLSFTCKQCGIVLKTKLGYIQHLRLHTGERPYECKICKETFSASSRRSEHMRKVHKGLDTLKHGCSLCPAKFRLPCKLRKHMKLVHMDGTNDGLQFECKECHEKFGSCRGLLHHSRKHQNVDFPYKRPEKSVILDVYSESYIEDEE